MQKPAQTASLPQEVQFIYSKQYKDVAAIEQQKYFGKLKRGVDMLPIDDKFFKTIQSLIKFFKFSFLLLLKKPFETILNDPKLLQQREADMKKIAKIAHDMISGGHIYELDFLFVKGIDHNFYKKIDIKEDKRKFIDYIKQLSATKKALYEKIKDKTITEDDIMAFQHQSFAKGVMRHDQLLENEVKICIKDVEAQYEEIKKQKKKQAKLQAEQRQRQARMLQTQAPVAQNTSSQQQAKIIKPTAQDDDLSDIMACCRRSFNYKQTIYQPQSINFIYRYYNNFFRRQHHYDILKSICGLLNSQGGYLFIGIREDRNTYKKQAEGYTIIERDKVEFKKMVEELVDNCILPNVSHDILKVQFVPLKGQDNKFISGKFLIKISVRFGDRKEFYSFKEDPDAKKEYFAVRTDNDTKLITSAQEILGIYKNRVLETPPDPLPIHKEACPWPEVGRPLYELEELGNKK